MTTIDEALDAFLAEQEKRLAERTYSLGQPRPSNPWKTVQLALKAAAR